MEPTVSYTQRDYASVRETLTNYIKQRFPKDWPEFAQTAVAQAILDCVAWAHGQRSFYIDMQAINCFLDTATLPEAVYALAQQLGYRVRLTTAASVPITFFPQPVQPVPIVIRKGTRVDIDKITFEAAQAYVIPAGKVSWPDSTTTEVLAFVEGETKIEEFVSTGEPYQKFKLSQPKVIQGSIEVAILGEIWEETPSLVYSEATGRGRDIFQGTGLDDQKYNLGLLHAIIDPESEDTIVVLVHGIKWLQVADFTNAPQEYKVTQDVDGNTSVLFGKMTHDSGPELGDTIDILYQISGSQKRYATTKTSDGYVTIYFGDGKTSAVIPPVDATITVNYRIGGGVAGNVRRGKIDTLVNGFLPSGNGTPVRVINLAAGSGGEENETVSHIKLFAPLYAKTNERAVTANDFAVLAATYQDQLYGALSFASAHLKQDYPEKNEVAIVVWSRDENGRVTHATDALKYGLKWYLDSKRTICTYIETTDGEVLYFDIDANVALRSGHSLAEIQEIVNVLLLNFFNSTFVMPGQSLSISLIEQEILKAPNIISCSLNNVQGSKLQELDNGTGDNATKTFSGHFDVPGGVGIVPGSFSITDGTQKITDDQYGHLVGDIDGTLTNEINYVSGEFTASFENAPALSTFITSEARIYDYFTSTTRITLAENKLDGITEFAPIVVREPIGIMDGQAVDVILPEIYLPYGGNQLLFIGGWDESGTQTGGQMLAYDDGSGNIVGDVQAGGTVNYETGELSFQWNSVPPPTSYTTFYGYLDAAPDGTLKDFEYEVRDAPDGGGNLISLLDEEGIGRLKFLFTDLSTLNVTFYDGWDNRVGRIQSKSLDLIKENTVVYEDPGLLYSKGTLHFENAPEAAAGRNFRIQVAPVTLFVYSAFTAFIPATAGYYKILMCDHEGRLFGSVSNPYPYASVDHLSGRYKAELTAPSAVNRSMTLVYDTQVKSIARDIPLDQYTMATMGILVLHEVNQVTGVQR